MVDLVKEYSETGRLESIQRSFVLCYRSLPSSSSWEVINPNTSTQMLNEVNWQMGSLGPLQPEGLERQEALQPLALYRVMKSKLICEWVFSVNCL